MSVRSAFDEVVMPLLLADAERRERARVGNHAHMEARRAERAEKDRVDADDHDWHLHAFLAEGTVVRPEILERHRELNRIQFGPFTDEMYEEMPRCKCCEWPADAK